MGSANVQFSGGSASVAGYGSWDRIIFSTGAAWTAGSTWTVAGVSLQGQFTLGIGYLGSDHTSGNYNTGLTMNRRVYIGQKDRVVFSSIADPTNPNTTGPLGWNVQDTGAGFFLIQNQYGQQDVVNGLAPFQGRLAVLGRYHVEIWSVSADPSQFQWIQTLSNTGTPASRSVSGSLGDLDLIFVDDSGLRSLRTLVTTLNASMYDVGSAVDDPIQVALLTADPTAIVSTVEPGSKRYWVAVGGTIYVLSYYPQAKIQAWSTYATTDSLGAAFNVTDFAILAGQVIVRGDNNKVYAYGGITKGTPTYDASLVTVLTPWLDHKAPKTRKQSKSVGAAFSGLWTFTACMQPSTGTTRQVISQGSNTTTPTESVDSALDLPVMPYTNTGTRIQIGATCSTQGGFANPVKLSLLEWIYQPREQL